MGKLTIRVFPVADYGPITRGEVEWSYSQMREVLLCHCRAETAGAYPDGLTVRAGAYWEHDASGSPEDRSKLRLRFVYLPPKDGGDAQDVILQIFQQFGFPVPQVQLFHGDSVRKTRTMSWPQYIVNHCHTIFMVHSRELMDEDEEAWGPSEAVLSESWSDVFGAYASDPTTPDRHSAKNVFTEDLELLVDTIVDAPDPNLEDCKHELLKKYVVVLHTGGRVREPWACVRPSAFDRHRPARFIVCASNTWRGENNDAYHIGWTAATVAKFASLIQDSLSTDCQQKAVGAYINYHDQLGVETNGGATTIVKHCHIRQFYGPIAGPDFCRLKTLKRRVDPDNLFYYGDSISHF